MPTSLRVREKKTASKGRSVLRARRPQDESSARRSARKTKRPLGEAPAGRSALRTSSHRTQTPGGSARPKLSEPWTRSLPSYSCGLHNAFSSILRHRAFEENVLILQDGFAPVDHVLRSIRRLRTSRADVERLVETSRHGDGTPRFEL